MTVSEAISRMQAVASEAKEKLDGNGFVMSVETDFMDSMLRVLPDESKAKYVTVSLIVGKEGGNAGEEYCLSLGAVILRNTVNEARLNSDIESYNKLVNDTVETLAEYEDKDEGLDYLTKKAGEEYEKMMAERREYQEKSRKISKIINAAFFVGMILLFIVMMIVKK